MPSCSANAVWGHDLLFFVRNKELKDAVEVDLGMRALVDSFYVGKAQ
jgi:hypothetical protein